MGFIAHPNPQIRQVAIVNCVPYSTTDPNLFKDSDLQPVKNLKLLADDHHVSSTLQADKAKFLTHENTECL